MYSPTYTLSHTHIYWPPLPPCPSCSWVWEQQCLHTIGTQAGCLGNHLALPLWRGKQKLVVHSWIDAITFPVEALSLFFCSHTLKHAPISCQTNTFKCILFQIEDLGCRGWVPLILGPGRMMLACCTMSAVSGSGCVPPHILLEDYVLTLRWCHVTVYNKQI